MLTWERTAKDFERYLLTTGRSPATVRTYASNLKIFYEWCARRECPPQDVPTAAIREWLAERVAVASSQRRYNNLASLKVFFAWQCELGFRDDNPTANVKVKRGRALPTEPLAPLDLKTLLDACRNERDRMIVIVLAGTGMRISELATLEVANIDWDQGLIRITGKGDKERRIAPNPDILAQLRAYVGRRSDGPLWFSARRHLALSAHQIRKIMYTLAERAKVANLHPHRLRSYFATEYIEQFADIQALQGLLGHESIETTARYSQYTRERRGLEQMRRFAMTGLEA